MDLTKDKPSAVFVSKLNSSRDILDNDQSKNQMNIFDKTSEICDKSSPILGRYFKLPDLPKSFDPNPPILDSSMPYIPVYTHLITHDLIPIERPKTPPLIHTLKSRNANRPKNKSKYSATSTNASESEDTTETTINRLTPETTSQSNEATSMEDH